MTARSATSFPSRRTWLRGPYGLNNRTPKLNEVEFQFSNQYHFSWLSGDDVPQTLTHNLDRVNWVMKGKTPARHKGSADGRPRSARSMATSSIIIRWCTNTTTACACTPCAGRKTVATRTTPASTWEARDSAILPNARSRAKIRGTIKAAARAPYDLEHAALFAAIRSGNPVNAGDYMAPSTLITVLGQLACYSGRELTWNQVAKSNFAYLPKPEDVRLDMEPPVKPDSQGNYPVPMPGITEFKI